MGFAIGNWLAIGRDERKEFNELADKIFISLSEEMAGIKETNCDTVGSDYSDLELFMRRLPVWDRPRFKVAFISYKKQKDSNNKKQDGYGQVFYKKTENIISSIHKLLKFTERK